MLLNFNQTKQQLLQFTMRAIRQIPMTEVAIFLLEIVGEFGQNLSFKLVTFRILNCFVFLIIFWYAFANLFVVTGESFVNSLLSVLYASHVSRL